MTSFIKIRTLFITSFLLLVNLACTTESIDDLETEGLLLDLVDQDTLYHHDIQKEMLKKIKYPYTYDSLQVVVFPEDTSKFKKHLIELDYQSKENGELVGRIYFTSYFGLVNLDSSNYWIPTRSEVSFFSDSLTGPRLKTSLYYVKMEKESNGNFNLDLQLKIAFRGIDYERTESSLTSETRTFVQGPRVEYKIFMNFQLGNSYIELINPVLTKTPYSGIHSDSFFKGAFKTGTEEIEDYYTSRWED